MVNEVFYIKVMKLERLNNSRDGNPRYKVFYELCSFRGIWEATTQTNSTIGYIIREGRNYKVKCHLTKKNRIMDNILETLTDEQYKEVERTLSSKGE